jgi:hypothetical protein
LLKYFLVRTILFDFGYTLLVDSSRSDWWGLDADGNFRRSSIFTPEDSKWYQLEDRSDVLIQRDIQTCRELTKEELFVLDPETKLRRSCTAEERMSRILYLMQRDLLGSPIASMVLEKKSIRECFHCDKTSFPAYNAQLSGVPVTRKTKLMMWVFLFVLLVAMVAYILYFAMLYPSQLQRAWLYTLYAFIAFDGALVSTAEVIFTHVWLPGSITADMRVVRDIMASTLRKFASTASMESNALAREFTGRAINTRMLQTAQNRLAEGDDEVPNISEFFFVSARLAQYFSELTEAKLVLTYATMLPPGALFPAASWWRPLSATLQDTDLAASGTAIDPEGFTHHHGLQHSRQRDYRSLLNLRSVPLIYAALLRSYLFSAVQTQDLLLQMLLIVLFGVIAILSLALYQILPYLVIAPAVVVLGVYLLGKVTLMLWRRVSGALARRREGQARIARERAVGDAETQTGQHAASDAVQEFTALDGEHGAPTSAAATGSSDLHAHSIVVQVVPKPTSAAILEQQRRTLINSSALRGAKIAPAPASPSPLSAAADARRRTVRREAIPEGSEYDSKSDDSSDDDSDSTIEEIDLIVGARSPQVVLKFDEKRDMK